MIIVNSKTTVRTMATKNKWLSECCRIRNAMRRISSTGVRYLNSVNGSDSESSTISDGSRVGSNVGFGYGGSGHSFRAFNFTPKVEHEPKLILIGGCTGTGKSTFGMSVALDQGILKCISTDTVRAVMRSFISPDISPPLHRSSYTPANTAEKDDPVHSWRETCAVMEASVEGLVDDAIRRRVSLVVEGVHVMPSNYLIDKWESANGNRVAVGCLLTIEDEESHKALLKRRAEMTGNANQEDKKFKAFDRVRTIQDEMISLAKQSNWLLIEQKLLEPEPDPIEMIASQLYMKKEKNINDKKSKA